MTDASDGGDLRHHVGLVELVNRVLDRGAVIRGEVVIGVGGVDLLYVGLQLVLSSVETMRERGVLPGDG